MASIPASSDNVQTADLCVSDVHKTLLLHNPDFIPYLVDGLLLDPDHPRAGLPEHAKAWLQTMHLECFAQLAVFPPGREALQADASVIQALQAVVDGALSDEGREFAQSALAALRDDQGMHPTSHSGPKHVMLSYQWSWQSVIVRIHESLARRGYLVWIDLEMMQGTTTDAMSEAIEDAAVM